MKRARPVSITHARRSMFPGIQRNLVQVVSAMTIFVAVAQSLISPAFSAALSKSSASPIENSENGME